MGCKSLIPCVLHAGKMGAARHSELSEVGFAHNFGWVEVSFRKWILV
jgi:hypothetical protein